ncbi:hypothetical protein [Paenibacillus faecis]|uniref:hypothetical protein n=1 Tax=Paenibacillus faecis TaxID=862114 RepID=UPI0014785417|nr:hypothetical protein [Paenibacillus faecis]
MLDKGLKTEKWTPERLAAHLKEIGADGPPPPRYVDNTITDSQKGHNGKYIKKWGTGK